MFVTKGMLFQGIGSMCIGFILNALGYDSSSIVFWAGLFLGNIILLKFTERLN